MVDYPKNQLSAAHRCGFCINMDEALCCDQLYGKLYEVIVKESICSYHNRGNIVRT